MSDADAIAETSGQLSEGHQAALARYLSGPNYARYARFIFAVLGSIPWVGSVFAASAALHGELEQQKVNETVRRWLEEHQGAFRRLEMTVAQIVERLEQCGPEAKERLDDERFLGLVRRGFRIWDEASTQEKRDYVRRTITNAAATRLCGDDLVRLFLQWIAQYDELHFKVIRVLYRAAGSTRADMWRAIHGGQVREDSAEADLFKLIIRDLSTGSVLRQVRETTYDGQFVAQRNTSSRSRRSPVLKSAFDDDKPYELTELGKQFVSYVLDEPTARLGA